MFNLISILLYVKSIYSEDISMAVMQQSRYSVFYDRNTLIELGLLWQSSPILLLSVFHYWNLYLGL